MEYPDSTPRLSAEQAVRLAKQRLLIDEVMDPKACTITEAEGPDTRTVHFEQPWAGGTKCDVLLSKDEFEILAVTYGQ